MSGNTTLFHRAKSNEKNIEKILALTSSTEKRFLIEPLTTNNVI